MGPKFDDDSGVNREWNWPIALSLIGATFVAGFNLWFLTEYRPLNPFWQLLTLGASVLAIVITPLLTYYKFRTEKKWTIPAAYFFLLSALSVGFILLRNGAGDPSAVVVHYGSITEKEISKTKGGAPAYKFRVRLDDPPHGPITVGTTKDKYDQLQVGARIGVPAKAGRYGIPWRVYHVPVSYPGERPMLRRKR